MNPRTLLTRIFSIALLLCGSVISLIAQKDMTPPVITYGNLRDTFCIEINSVWTLSYTVTDNQSDKNHITTNVIWGYNGPVNSTMRKTYPLTIEATDSNGNKSSLTLNLRVDDCTSPVINLNTPDTICVKWRTPYNSVTPSVTDNYYGPGQVSLVKKSSDIDPNVIGIYQEVYEAVDGSGNTTTKTRFVVVKENCPNSVGLRDILSTDLSIYPQPVSGILNIKIDAYGILANLSVYTPEGKLMYKVDALSNMSSINVSQWPSGIYFLHLNAGESISLRKIVVQH